jgi:hypothetical protein
LNLSSSRSTVSNTNENRDDRGSSTAYSTTSGRTKQKHPAIISPPDTTSNKLYPPTGAVDPQLDDEFLIDSKLTMSELKESWGVLLDDFNIAPDTVDADAPLSRSRLENVPEAILMSESWNKVLAFRSMFSESIVGRWRVLAAADEIQRNEEAKFKSRFWTKSVLSSVKSSKNTVENFQYRILRMIESNNDPIAKQFGMRTSDLEILVFSALDAAIRELCPHAQVVQRESYRPVMGSADPDPSFSSIFYHENECTTFEEYCAQLGKYGVLPRHFLALGRAFLWSMKEHNPYSLEDEIDDLDLPTNEGVHARFIAGMFILPIIEVSLRKKNYLRANIFQDLKRHVRVDNEVGRHFEMSATHLFDNFFGEYPALLNHLSVTDADELKLRLAEM